MLTLLPYSNAISATTGTVLAASVLSRPGALSIVLVVMTNLILPASRDLYAQELTRREEIELQQKQKAATASQELNSRSEQWLLRLRDDHLLDRLLAGYRGIKPKIGGLATGGGFALGPQYQSTSLLKDRGTLTAAYQASTRGFQRYQVSADFPSLRASPLSASLLALHHNYPNLEYYGPGPNSEKTGRSTYRLEDTAVDGTLSLRGKRGLITGVSGGWVANNIGPGTSRRFIAADRQYTNNQAPGIVDQTNFARLSGFLQWDTRDPDGRSGGNYMIQASRLTDLIRTQHDHVRLSAEGQQLISFFNGRRVIALRGRVISLEANDGKVVPFYMQSVLGGSESLRGYRAWRFHGNHSVLYTAEYRWEIFSGLDMAVFADAGKVTDRRRDLSFSDLESSVGFGFRFNARNRVMMRIDTGFSHEGFQVWIKFNPVFSRGPIDTSSSQGEHLW